MASSLSSMLRQIGRSLLNTVVREARHEVENRARDAVRQSTGQTSGSKKKSGGQSTSSTSNSQTSAKRQQDSGQKAADGSTVRTGMDINEVPIKKAFGYLDYSPNPDGIADPGEVVWTWIPYEEDETRGKDRPVLVMGKMGDDILVAQMTSKNHDEDREQEAHWGRYWLSVGSGPWDPKGRPSEVRLDRVLAVPQDEVRRQGSAMPKAKFKAVVDAMEKLAKSGKA